jgi:prevent-host-death family protein
MPKTVNIHEAQTLLSRLIRRVQSGEGIVMARGGKPVARLVPVEPATNRALGRDRGLFTVPHDFNEPLDPETDCWSRRL